MGDGRQGRLDQHGGEGRFRLGGVLGGGGGGGLPAVAQLRHHPLSASFRNRPATVCAPAGSGLDEGGVIVVGGKLAGRARQRRGANLDRRHADRHAAPELGLEGAEGVRVDELRAEAV